MIRLEDADSVLKNYYLGAVKSQLDGDCSPFYNAIEKTSDNVSGRYAYFAFADGSANGVAAVGEDDDLPTPRADSYADAAAELKNIYGTIEISDKAIRATGNVTYPFVNVLNSEMEGLIASAKANFARMLYGDGNGYLCSVVSKKDGTTLVVDNAKSYFIGYPVLIDHTSQIETEIIGVDTDAGTITVGTDLSDSEFEGGEKIYVLNAEDKELTGLAAIFDGTGIYGKSKSLYRYLNPFEKTYERNALTEENLVDMIDLLEERSDSKVDMILCSFRTRKKLASLMSSSRRIVNTTEINAGYSSIIINDVPVYADKFCPENRIYFVNTRDFSLCQLCDWSWLEGDGGRILHQIPGKAAYSATLVKYAELVCKKPCGQGLIRLS